MAINVYLCGPMRNCMNHNAEAFRAAEHELVAAGFTVESPLHYDWDHNFDVRGTGFEEDDAPRMFNIRAAFAASFEYICLKADALAVLPHWERSDGAQAQVLTAWRMHVPCYAAGNLAAFGLDGPQLQRRGYREGHI